MSDAKDGEDDHSVMEYSSVDKSKNALAILDTLNKQRDDPAQCDLAIIVGDQKVFAHKCILTAVSPYFNSMLTGDFVEGAEAKSLGSIDMSHAIPEPGAFSEILRYIYTGKMTITMDAVEDILASASLLLVKEVVTACAQHLLMNLTLCNCLHTLALAELYELQDLKLVAKKLVSDRLHDVVISQEEILNVPYEFLVKILADKEVIQHCSTFQLVNLVVKWTEQNLEERHGHLISMLDAFQWGKLSPGEVEVITNNPLVSKVNTITQYIANSNISPDIQSTKKECLIAHNIKTNDNIQNLTLILFNTETKTWYSKTVCLCYSVDDTKKASNLCPMIGFSGNRILLEPESYDSEIRSIDLISGECCLFAKFDEAKNYTNNVQMFVLNDRLYAIMKSTRSKSIKQVELGKKSSVVTFPSEEDQLTKVSIREYMESAESAAQGTEWRQCYQSPEYSAKDSSFMFRQTIIPDQSALYIVIAITSSKVSEEKPNSLSAFKVELHGDVPKCENILNIHEDNADGLLKENCLKSSTTKLVLYNNTLYLKDDIVGNGNCGLVIDINQKSLSTYQEPLDDQGSNLDPQLSNPVKETLDAKLPLYNMDTDSFTKKLSPVTGTSLQIESALRCLFGCLIRKDIHGKQIETLPPPPPMDSSYQTLTNHRIFAVPDSVIELFEPIVVAPKFISTPNLVSESLASAKKVLKWNKVGEDTPVSSRQSTPDYDDYGYGGYDDYDDYDDYDPYDDYMGYEDSDPDVYGDEYGYPF